MFRRPHPAITGANWGGIYFGFNLGRGFGTSVWSDPIDPGGGTTGNFNLRGFLTGVTVGANFQTDAFVFGAEADFDGSWIDGKVSSPFCSWDAMRDQELLVFDFARTARLRC